MLRKIKYSKIAVVVLLTVLIWVWTDLTLDETFPVSGAKISMDESRSNRWVSFDEKASVSIDNVVLKGPASKISDVKRKIKDRPPSSPSFEFFLDAEQEGMVEPNEYPLDVQNFLRKNDQIRQFGLTVESCKPATLTVKVVELVEKSLTVQCFDENGNSQKTDSTDPSTVSMFVPEDWGRNEPARVELTRREIEKARAEPMAKTPYIVLPDGQIRLSSTVVQIKIPPEEDRLDSYRITATVGYCLGANLQGKYKVDVDNLSEVMSPIAIRATLEAQQAYEAMRYKVILEIDDEDAKSEGWVRTPLIYNFPDDSVGKGEIELNQQPVTAQFKLIPLPSADGS
ncbi:MAG: hypothetical protein ACYSYV_09450 [Planctomycetota bacterium]|jgi:hypothetical protein